MFLFSLLCAFFSFFFFNDPATTEIYTLSLHDALPISIGSAYCPRSTTRAHHATGAARGHRPGQRQWRGGDRKSTRLNSSHVSISYAVFCLKKKKKKNNSKKNQHNNSRLSALNHSSHSL